MPETQSNKVSSEDKLLNFFKKYPGLIRLVGGITISFYTPHSADHFLKTKAATKIQSLARGFLTRPRKTQENTVSEAAALGTGAEGKTFCIVS